MEIIYHMMDLAARLPELLSLILCPAILSVLAVIFAVFGKKRLYAPFALALGGIGFFLTFSFSAQTGFAFLGLYLAYASVLSFLFLIPFRRNRADSQEELFQRFYTPLDAVTETAEEEEEKRFDKEECDLRLSHTLDLLERLKKRDLSAADRLEADALLGTLEGMSDRELSAVEMRSLNDCLATILKLTAKYKL